MAVNENKWLYVGHEFLYAGDEKKVPNHLKCEAGANFLQEQLKFKKKKIESYMHIK